MMQGLTAKVFRTCNASRLFQNALMASRHIETSAKKHYHICNMKVSKLCNHVVHVNGKTKTCMLTTRSNYIDPRITYAYCKRNNIHIGVFFSDRLQLKHCWAENAGRSFVF